ncbi:RES domain-containing protein [Ekhidna lutea]|uniref:RES domain-containing protein n=1 Tax=Ekhidna lutea TaxID=447679 RepID=A0A239L8Q0_EKHLU|nr:RES family NAD+ phosphorylase [Ekhidna lutea]SNT26223.1 RES domain-containing protein [Ekhidna lutea]
MIVYRLTLPKYADDLSGMGAALFGGRWNSIGNFMLYTAQTSSLSILEHLVHITGADSFKYLLLALNVDENQVEDLRTSLPENWKSDENTTSKIGDQWIKNQFSAILKVPSAINPLESNFLINPNHPDLKMEIVNQDWFVYDRRLMKS